MLYDIIDKIAYTIADIKENYEGYIVCTLAVLLVGAFFGIIMIAVFDGWWF